MSKPIQVYAVYYREGKDWTTPSPGIPRFNAALTRAKWLVEHGAEEAKIMTFTHTSTRNIYPEGQ
jgi:hypothetical protein